MTHLDEEFLAALALDDGDDLSAEQLRHYEACRRCRAEVDDLRDFRALLGSARSEPLAQPPSTTWLQIRNDVEGRRGGGTSVPKRSSLTWLAAAASVAALVGGGFWWGRASSPTPAPNPVVLASVPLQTMVEHRSVGTAQVHAGRNSQLFLDVSATQLPTDATGFHEVWLINIDGKRMVSVGLLDPSGQGSFEIPATLWQKGYRIVDISQESDDGNPVHSGESLVRGTLPKKA